MNGVFLFGAVVLWYGLFLAKGIAGADAGDLVTAATTLGVAHPPGYPLYTMLAFVFTHIPFFSIAWRVGLISVISQATVVLGVYYWVRKFTKQEGVALLTGTLIAGNYIFFSYAIVPEVFALLNIFVLSILSLLLAYMYVPLQRTFLIVCFVIGLSLTHHHMTVLLIPLVLFWIWKTQSRGLRHDMNVRTLVYGAGMFGIGMLPYLYVVVAAHGNSIVNWDAPKSLDMFIRLISRADYGSFQIAESYAATWGARFTQLLVYARLLVADIGVFGVTVSVLGGAFLYRTSRNVSFLLLGALLLLGPVFFFYASFPLVNSFALGTYERFLLPSYLIWYIFLGCGLGAIWEWMKHRLTPIVGSVAPMVGFIILGLVLHGSTVTTVERYAGIADDMTVEHFAEDILSTAPARSMVFLGDDTPLFSSLYVRYAEKRFSDRIVLHAARFARPDYWETVSRYYPSLRYPEQKTAESFYTLLELNYDQYPIYSNQEIVMPEGWIWIREGLLARLYKQADRPSNKEIYEINEALWARYHDPLAGVLSRYRHLMLGNVADLFSDGLYRYGNFLLSQKDAISAERYYERALQYGTGEHKVLALIQLGQTQSELKKCTEALATYDEVALLKPKEAWSLLPFRAMVYKNCLGDLTKSAELTAQYDERKKMEETPLSPR